MLQIPGSGVSSITVVCGEARFRYAHLAKWLNTARLLYMHVKPQDGTLPILKQQLAHEQQYQQIPNLQTMDFLVLDGCDELPNDVLMQFIHEELTEVQHIVLLCEQLPDSFFNEPQNHGLIHVITDDSRRPSILPYTGTTTTTIKVQALRRGHVYIGKNRVNNWRGNLQRDLFYYFADHKAVDKEAVIRTFWKHLQHPHDSNNFFVARRKLHQHIGLTLIKSQGRGVYQFAEGITLEYDVDEFMQAVNEAMQTDGERRIQLLKKAVALYRVPFLEGIHLGWVVKRRQELAAMAIQALQLLAKYYLMQQRWDVALGYLIRAFPMERGNEVTAHDIMQVYLQMGCPAMP